MTEDSLGTGRTQSFNWFEAFVQSSSEAFVGQDLSGTVIVWSRAAEQLLGFPAAEVIGSPINRLFPNGRLPQNAQAGESPGQFETRMLEKSGRLIDASISSSPLQSPSGSCVGVAWVVRRQKKSADEERDKLSLLVEKSSDMITLADMDGRLTFMNSSGRKMIGFDGDDVSTLNLKDYVPPGWEEFFKKEVVETAIKEGIWQGEMQLKNLKTGDLIDVYRTTFLISNSSDQKQFLATVNRNITLQKKAERDLKSSETRLAAAQELALLGSWEIELATQHRIWSREMYVVHGYDPNLPPPRFEEFLLTIHPADRAGIIPGRVENSDFNSLAYEYRTNPERGPIRHLRSTVKVLRDESGKPSRWLGITQDISVLRSSEARIRRIIESNAQGLYFWNIEGQITRANGAFLNLIGYTQEDIRARRLNWRTLTPPGYEDLDMRLIGETSAKGFCTPSEKEYFRKDGTRIPVLISSACFEDNPNEGICFVLDLTERKRLEQQFLRSQRMESIGTLAGGMAHDLNNILAPILLSIGLLKSVATDPTTEDILDTIEESANRGADIVRQVLSIARGVRSERIEIPPDRVLGELAPLIKDTFPKNIELKLSLPAEPWRIMGDATQIHQALLNLCVNARDAMPQGGILEILVENTTLDDGAPGAHPPAVRGNYVLIQVADNGSGMDQSIIDKIFEPFFTTKQLGTGLGLSTVMAIVKSHGGTIRVNSTLGTGTSFQVYFPATIHSLPDGNDPRRKAAPASGAGKTILLVDDENSILSITKRVLTGAGYKVLTAPNGAEGLTKYIQNQRSIDLVVTDSMMPVMDGPSLIRAIREINPDARIILTSGFTSVSEPLHQKFLDEGLLLKKPFTKDALLGLAQAILSA